MFSGDTWRLRDALQSMATPTPYYSWQTDHCGTELMNVLQPCPSSWAETFQFVHIYYTSEGSTEPIRLRTMRSRTFLIPFFDGRGNLHLEAARDLF
jgi:hypothetical protein